MKNEMGFGLSVAPDSDAPERLDFALSLTVVQQFERALEKQRGVASAIGALVRLTGAKDAILQASLPPEITKSRDWQYSSARPPTVVSRKIQNTETSAGECFTLSRGRVELLKPETPRSYIDWIGLVLGIEEREPEYLLLEFHCVPAVWCSSDVIDLSKILAETWAYFGQSRMPKGTIPKSAAAAQDAGILHLDNPFNLTRSEFKVCELLGRGNRPVSIAQELGVGMATVRTHLSNIYAKTGLGSQMEVVYHLHARNGTNQRDRV